MSLTKVTKPVAQYHVFTASDLTNGCIIGVTESLGSPARQVMIESLGGATDVRFNVSNQVFERQDVNNSGIPSAGFWTRPSEITELEIATDMVEVLDGTVKVFDTFPIRDIKVIGFGTSVRITVTR